MSQGIVPQSMRYVIDTLIPDHIYIFSLALTDLRISIFIIFLALDIHRR